VRQLAPHARIAIAHGQLREADLERIMFEFYAGDYDILVCTTIIENGLDVPNVNTLVVDRADIFGLAQLYQLRGRVGRSNRQAYAYLMWTPHKRLTDRAHKRIAAIKEFSHLGSGFRIALRDLEIRGAGNLLHAVHRLRALHPDAGAGGAGGQGRGRRARAPRIPRPAGGRLPARGVRAEPQPAH
jgi:transcription-repair coupling factor (superfamily II helicase)